MKLQQRDLKNALRLVDENYRRLSNLALAAGHLSMADWIHATGLVCKDALERIEELEKKVPKELLSIDPEHFRETYETKEY